MTEFDRWLARHDRQVAAEALRDVARRANQEFVAQQAGIGPARVRTDVLFAWAEELSASHSQEN